MSKVALMAGSSQQGKHLLASVASNWVTAANLSSPSGLENWTTYINTKVGVEHARNRHAECYSISRQSKGSQELSDKLVPDQFFYFLIRRCQAIYQPRPCGVDTRDVMSVIRGPGRGRARRGCSEEWLHSPSVFTPVQSFHFVVHLASEL